MELVTYLFIDGGYVNQVYRRAMEAVFGNAGDLCPQAVAHQAGAFKTFYYDCPDDLRKDGESDRDFAARTSSQEQFFAKLRALRGVHLQLGTLRGQRRRSQKEVAVLLAVDMITHAYDRNMTRAVLIAGDLDFRPIVEALVRRGVFVEVWYVASSVANELRWAADSGIEINWHGLWNWGSETYRALHTVPTRTAGHAPLHNPVGLAAGTLNHRKVSVSRGSNGGGCVLYYDDPSAAVWLEHDDINVLKRYFEAMFGTATWMK